MIRAQYLLSSAGPFGDSARARVYGRMVKGFPSCPMKTTIHLTGAVPLLRSRCQVLTGSRCPVPAGYTFYPCPTSLDPDGTNLLDCHTLGQVAGLIHVAPAADGDVIGQELKRDGEEDGR